MRAHRSALGGDAGRRGGGTVHQGALRGVWAYRPALRGVRPQGVGLLGLRGQSRGRRHARRARSDDPLSAGGPQRPSRRRGIRNAPRDRVVRGQASGQHRRRRERRRAVHRCSPAAGPFTEPCGGGMRGRHSGRAKSGRPRRDRTRDGQAMEREGGRRASAPAADGADPPRGRESDLRRASQARHSRCVSRAGHSPRHATTPLPTCRARSGPASRSCSALTRTRTWDRPEPWTTAQVWSSS